MARNNYNHSKSLTGSWFRTVMSSVISYTCGGVALMAFLFIVTGTYKEYMWIEIVILIVALVGAVAGLMMGGKRIDVDPKTGHAKKKYL